MLKKSLYFIMIATLLFTLLPVSAFAQNYYFTDTPGNVNSPLNHLTDYLKAPGDSVTVVIDDGQEKTTYYYSFVSKGTDSNGDYVIADEKIIYTYDTVTDQKKIYVPYIPHKIGTITYLQQGGYYDTNIYTKTLDVYSMKNESDDYAMKSWLQDLHTQRYVKGITAINGIPIQNTQYWYFGLFLPQDERLKIDDDVQNMLGYEWPSIFYTINVNGKPIDYTKYGSMPYINKAGGGTMMIPYRALFEQGFGLSENQVVWNGSDQSVTVTRGNTVIKLQIGSTTAYINGKPYTMNVAPELKFDRTYIPLRFASEGLGYKVNWTPYVDKQGDTPYGYGTVDINDN